MVACVTPLTDKLMLPHSSGLENNIASLLFSFERAISSSFQLLKSLRFFLKHKIFSLCGSKAHTLLNFLHKSFDQNPILAPISIAISFPLT